MGAEGSNLPRKHGRACEGQPASSAPGFTWPPGVRTRLGVAGEGSSGPGLEEEAMGAAQDRDCIWPGPVASRGPRSAYLHIHPLPPLARIC